MVRRCLASRHRAFMFRWHISNGSSLPCRRKPPARRDQPQPAPCVELLFVVPPFGATCRDAFASLILSFALRAGWDCYRLPAANWHGRVIAISETHSISQGGVGATRDGRLLARDISAGQRNTRANFHTVYRTAAGRRSWIADKRRGISREVSGVQTVRVEHRSDAAHHLRARREVVATECTGGASSGLDAKLRRSLNG